MECNFYVGQKVVCIDDDASRYNNIPGYTYIGSLDGLTKGEIYTIDKIYPHPMLNYILVDVREIDRMTKNPDRLNACGYRYERFKPLEEKKRTTDISIFIKMCETETRKLKETI